MTQALTWRRDHWQALLFLAALIFSGFLAGVVYSVTDIDNTIADYIEANGCPVKGEDW